MGIKEVVINLRASNQALEKRLLDVKRQNAKLRDFAVHDCEICRVCRCPERERLFRAAFARELLTLHTRGGEDHHLGK